MARNVLSTFDIRLFREAQIWSKLDTGDQYVASVMARLSDITEKLPSPSLKQNPDVRSFGVDANDVMMI